MADFRNAGIDRGDIRAELKNFLLAIRIRKEEYMNIIDELEPDELEFDLREYKEYFEKQVKPIYEQAHAVGVESLVALAEEVKRVYDEIINMIESKLSYGKQG
ncbi:hypothetical protein BCF55_0015 [Hydrogenivirga caldilitoris]|uniref:Uncharacterized protein n=1 Tax=Hydrogenivirga caldilitoris TaxID=246264 RepID=A0A497XNP6_9AQUI|nr:hypothetical protein [Hydrogenivirga caldilitoris]RLJ69760.1 hypothetical protein BCF55_0015 [Hydrogenivirga caldilitoris]